MYQSQGAHAETRDGITGTRFAVWAPNAEEVSVLCDANGWTPGSDKLHGSDSGVWSGFIAGMGHGAGYKYGIRTRDGETLEKSDPVAFATEHQLLYSRPSDTDAGQPRSMLFLWPLDHVKVPPQSVTLNSE